MNTARYMIVTFYYLNMLLLFIRIKLKIWTTGWFNHVCFHNNYKKDIKSASIYSSSTSKEILTWTVKVPNWSGVWTRWVQKMKQPVLPTAPFLHFRQLSLPCCCVSEATGVPTGCPSFPLPSFISQRTC